MREFMSGLIVAGYVVISLYFLRFWRESGDRLFGSFALAFALLAVQRGLLTVSLAEGNGATLLYLLRLLAFLIIIAAVIDKNRQARPG